MTTETEQSAAAMERELRARLSNDLFERLLSQLPGSAKSEIVFGPKVERADVVVIPVARIRYGFGFGRGGGSGPRGMGQGEGGGGGGGVLGDPIGFIEVRDGQTRFVPIRSPYSWREALIGLVVCGLTLTVVTALRTERKGQG